MRKPLWRRITQSVVMILLACFVAVPLYYIVVNTFKSQADMVASPMAPPTSLYLDSYREVLSDNSILSIVREQPYMSPSCRCCFSCSSVQWLRTR